MLIKIDFNTPRIPILYRHRIISLIKESLKISGEKEALETYYSRASGVSKPFTFNLVFPRNDSYETSVKIDEKFEIDMKVYRLKPSGWASLYISSPDNEFMIYLYNGLRNMKEFRFSGENEMLVDGESLVWKQKKITMINGDFRPSSTTIQVRINSPVILEGKKNDVPILPEMVSDRGVSWDEYSKAFSEINALKVSKVLGYDSGGFVVRPAGEIKRSVVKHTLKEFREYTGKPYMYLTGITGNLEMSGNPVSLGVLAQMGLGVRTGQGFGMVEVKM